MTAGLPIYVREIVAEARATRLEPLRRLPAPDAAALILISVVRNERAILDDFLAHHRRLGIDRFVIIDNGSTDATPDLLAAQPDVDLYRVRRPFRAPGKQGWITRAIAEYGHDRWYACADADEHLVFHGAGARTLRDMIALAERRRLRRVRGMLVDMYAAGPVLAASRGPATLAESFPLFDSDSYTETFCKQRISRHGGPRRRTFSSGCPEFSPELTKYPLFRISAHEVFDNPHHIYPYGSNFESPCYMAILHYKFSETFEDKIMDAVTREQYSEGSLEYKHYLDVLSDNRDLTLSYPGSRRYRDPADLVACGLIEPITWDRPQPPRRTPRARLFGWGRRQSEPAAG